jgi:hypothetical protein
LYLNQSVIRDALGLASPGEISCAGRRVTENIVFDAEMVAFSDRDNKIDGQAVSFLLLPVS